MIQHVQQHAGAVGAGVTAASGAAAWMAKAMPTLQFISVTLSIIVGILTAAWYIRKFYKGE